MYRRLVKEKTVYFTGHQSERLPKGDALEHLRIRLAKEIKKAIQDGYNTFLFGGSHGWDLIAAEEVIKKRTVIDFNNPRCIRLIAVIPFEEQAVGYSRPDHELYYEIMPKCDEVVTLNIHYNSRCYGQRNQYMADHSSRVICYWNGQAGSRVAQAIHMAEKAGLEIINLYE